MICRRHFLQVLYAALLIGSAALAASGQALSDNILKAITFRSIGPTRQSGRFVDLAVPLQTPGTFYAATASGGLWKTVNNGQTFTPLFDHQPVFSIGDIAVAPSAPSIIWVGTGEANNSRSTYWGDGVYKSTDGGKTWSNMGLGESHHVGRIVVHPQNPDIVYVAALGHLYSPNLERGLYKTIDGGKNWQQVLKVNLQGRQIGCVDVVLDPRNPDILYAATYDRLRRPWTYDIGGPGSRIWKSSDAGANWTELSNGLPGGLLGRIGLAVYAKNPDILYVTIENVNKPGMSEAERWQEIQAGKSSEGMVDGEVYRSDDAGASWRKVSQEKRSVGGAPGYYYGQVIIDPQDDKHVYVLSVNVFETTDSGQHWNPRAFAFGGDNHALWIDPADSNHMLLGYDHGLGITYDRGKTWSHADNLPLAQFYAVDFDMSTPFRLAGGTQDNGSLMGPSTKKARPASRRMEMAAGTAEAGLRSGPPILLEDWYTVGGGDGMYNAFDRKTNRFLYNEFQFGELQRVDLATGETKNIQYKGKDLRFNWCAPLLVSAHDSDTLYHCSNIVLKSVNRGETWTEVSPDLTTNDPAKLAAGKGGDGNIQYCTITAFDESPLVAGLLWAGTDDGNVCLTKNGGKDWVKLNDKIPGYPGYWVSRVTASSNDPGTAYLAFSGYRQDDLRPFLYKTADYGQTWTSLAGNLPAAPVNAVAEHPRNPKLLFVGTELGVYMSIDAGLTWNALKNGLPTQPIHDLKVHPRDKDLIAASHGRGLFIADISPVEELSAQVLAEDVHLFSVEPKIRWLPGLDRNSSSSNYLGESEPAGAVFYYTLKSKPKAETVARVYKGNMLISEFKVPAEAGLNKAAWDMTVRRALSEEEKKARLEQMRRLQETGASGGQVDSNYAYSPAGAGLYCLVLAVDGKEYSGIVEISEEHVGY
jgi:photosystem II stability/assembly factor-like uncharacterized protein